VLLVDHRGHGESTGGTQNVFPPPHTVEACVQDTRRLVKSLLDKGEILTEPSVIIGHSFGGKVSLKYRDEVDNSSVLTWVLDATPGPINPEIFDTDNEKESVVRLKKVLRTLPPWTTKAQLVKLLTDAHFSQMVAQWMTTNVVTKEDGSAGFMFDLDTVDQLFEDYCRIDMFPGLKQKAVNKPVHFLRAGRNRTMWTSSVLEKFEHDVDKDTVFLHTMPKAGHFLHAEDPDGVYNIITKTLD
jgi:pimeloyl-ACP methyl ester carboxylesterase